jgi:xanthine dehydrogenase accessory factor
MRDILDEIAPWYREGTRFALATVIRTWSSSPRAIGASMAVSETGEVIGSVSGGCVEGAVYDVAQEVLETGVAQLVRYGVSDDNALSAGLTCGGTLELFVQPIDATTFPDLDYVVEAVANRQPIAIGTVVDGSASVGSRLLVTPSGIRGSLGPERLDQATADNARGMLEHGTTGVLHVGPQGERRSDEVSVFVESLAPPPRMIVFGAIDFAAAVARIGKFLGYHVTVCDARPVFATRTRFAEADEVVVAWPHKYLAETEVDERTVLCVLTHDPSSMCRSSNWHCARQRVMSAPWAAVELTDSGSPGYVKTVSRRANSPGCVLRSGWTSAPGHPRRPQSQSQRRSSRRFAAAAAVR